MEQLAKSKYKQTEVGLIPEDWEDKRIDAVCKLINGRGFKPYEWRTTGLPIIRIQNLNGSDDFNYYQGNYDNKIEVHKGQLLFAWSGSRGTSFGPHVWNGAKGLLNYHTWKIAVNEEVIDKDYFLYALRQLTKHIEDNAHGASALVHTQKWEMEGFKFPIPKTKKEQRAIATVLSDTDALLQALEKKIVKKKLIKKGVMQELLTPKEGWCLEKLGNLCGTITTGKLDANAMVKDGVYRFYTCAKDHYYINNYAFDSEALLVSGNGANVGYIHYYKGKFNAYQRTYVLSGFKENALFIKQFMDKFLRIRIDEQKNDGNTPYIKMDTLTEMEIQYPSGEEQRQIVSILSEIDNEIELLEQKLSKYQLAKQGMMQQLLTGKIRLV